MAQIPYIYKDPGLTQPFDDAVDTLGASAVNGGEGDGVFYVGDPRTTIKIQTLTNPGIDQIAVSITDTAPGSDVEATHARLALTQGGLAGATPGASLNLGATINGGVGNGVAVWYRWGNVVGGGSYTDLTFDIPELAESAI